MTNRSRFVATVFLIASACVLTCLAQTTSKPNPSSRPASTITGRVTVHGQGLSGVMVALWDRSSFEPQQQASIIAKSDPDGNYRIANIPIGNYSIAPRSSEYVLTENGEPAPPRFVVIEGGEAVEAINFEMLRGGVITGTITNSDHKPILEAFVNLIRVGPEATGQASNSIPSGRLVGRTDDRGIYRMYGIPSRIFSDPARPLGKLHLDRFV